MWAPGYEHLRSALKTTKYIVLKRSGDGIVALYPELNVVLKRRYPNPTPKYQVKWEYEVGIAINSYNNPNMVKTLGCFMTSRDNVNIVTEYVRGVTLDCLKPEQHTKELYMRILQAVRIAQEQMEFTHYDLNATNIIVESNGNIRFIDYARTHVRGVGPGWFETGIIDAATCPGIFDPMFDYATIVANFKRWSLSSFDLEMKEMLISNHFSIETNNDDDDNEWPIAGYPRVMYYSGNLTTGDIAWASTTETLEGSPEEYTGDDYKILAAICLGAKLRQMQMRRNTPEEFYQACLDFINS